MVRPPPPLLYIILLKSLADLEKFKGPRGKPACGPPRADPCYKLIWFDVILSKSCSKALSYGIEILAKLLIIFI